jgi:hypothetical protein
MKLMEPVGVPPAALFAMALKVTEPPKDGRIVARLRATMLLSLRTVWVSAALVEPVKLASKAADIMNLLADLILRGELYYPRLVAGRCRTDPHAKMGAEDLRKRFA